MATLVMDFASTDGVRPPNIPQCKAAGIRAMFPRAIYGRSYGTQSPVYKDPVWDLNKDAIKAAGLKRGAWALLCMPRNGLITPTPEVQMQAFIDCAPLQKPTPGGYCGDYVPFIDVEEESNLSSDLYYDWVHRAAVYLYNHYKVWPGVYDSRRVWLEYTNGHVAGDLGNCFPWYAKPWPVAPRSPAILDGYPQGTPTVPSQFGDSTWWGLYQYQGDAIGVPGTVGAVDLSRPNLIKQGATGDIVRTIQKIVGVAVDGSWGPITNQGVKDYQAHWMGAAAADGIVGLDTLAVMSWQWQAPR